jgi:hypothetical protein
MFVRPKLTQITIDFLKENSKERDRLNKMRIVAECDMVQFYNRSVSDFQQRMRECGAQPEFAPALIEEAK